MPSRPLKCLLAGTGSSSFTETGAFVGERPFPAEQYLLLRWWHFDAERSEITGMRKHRQQTMMVRINLGEDPLESWPYSLNLSFNQTLPQAYWCQGERDL